MNIEDLISGLQLIAADQPDAQIDAQHDIIYAVSYVDGPVDKGVREQLESDGWFEQFDSWAHFI